MQIHVESATATRAGGSVANEQRSNPATNSASTPTPVSAAERSLAKFELALRNLDPQFAQLLQSQLDHVANTRALLEALIKGDAQTNPLELLKQTLARHATQSNIDSLAGLSLLDTELTSFSQELYQAIIKLGNNPQALRALLEKSLLEIYDRFYSNSLAVDNSNGEDSLTQLSLLHPRLELSDKNRATLRQIVGHTHNALTTLEGEVPSANRSALLKQVTRIQETIEQAISQRSTPPQFSQVLRGFSARLVNLESATTQSIDKALKSVLQQSEQLLKSEPRPSTHLTPHSKEIVSNISQQIRSVLASIPTLDMNTAQAPSNAINSSDKIMSLLGDLERKLSSQKSDVAQQLREVLQTVTREVSTRDLNELRDSQRDSLTRALELLNQTAEQQLSKPSSSPHLGLAQALRALEQAFQSQELFSKTNQLMQALNEPALLLFPGLMQGLLSQLALQSPHGGVEQTRKKRKGKKPRSHFHQVVFEAELPVLGLIMVKIAHSDRECLISIIVENSSVAQRCKTDLHQLKKVLHRLGYSKIDLTLRERGA